MRESLTKQERLKSKRDISRVFAEPKKVSCFGAKLFYRENGLDRNRFMVSLVRKYGTAVRRNRAKRVTREAYRLMKRELVQGYDLVVVLFPQTDTFDRRSEQLRDLFSRAEMFTQTTSLDSGA
ncbi:MAG TPA: ribonuclease P protein component [Sediminispirochaeta sp.]|nr:ribonuclease P protein component [Sediminispirochaeta sp.]